MQSYWFIVGGAESQVVLICLLAEDKYLFRLTHDKY